MSHVRNSSTRRPASSSDLRHDAASTAVVARADGFFSRNATADPMERRIALASYHQLAQLNAEPQALAAALLTATLATSPADLGRAAQKVCTIAASAAQIATRERSEPALTLASWMTASPLARTVAYMRLAVRIRITPSPDLKLLALAVIRHERQLRGSRDRAPSTAAAGNRFALAATVQYLAAGLGPAIPTSSADNQAARLLEAANDSLRLCTH